MSRSVSLLTTLWMVCTFLQCTIQKDHLQLQSLAESDQKDRIENNPRTSVNDVQRLKEVYHLLDSLELRTANDHFHAAIVLQHGEKPEDFLKANELAQKAVALDPDMADAKTLIAQSMDRYLVNTNRPQHYGTQRTTLGDLDYLHPIDTTAVTDAERRALGVSTLEEKLQYFNKMHRRQETDISAYYVTDSLYHAYYPEVRAELIGTFDELLARIEYPEEALKNDISGKVLVEYTIDKDGSTKDIMVADGIGYGCDEEAKRIISLARYKNFMGQDIQRRTRIPFVIQDRK
ncbi:energy transducer TonB [Flavilitoribacter nigricans]|nr:energy transducer TonB [Flavilitoribacter nigricans]